MKTHGNLEFKEEYDNGNSGVSFNIDWSKGNHQKLTLTGDCNITFTNPVGMGIKTLKLVQDAVGTRLVTWPANVNWSGGATPTLTTTGLIHDIVTLRFNGVDYDGGIDLNFS